MVAATTQIYTVFSFVIARPQAEAIYPKSKIYDFFPSYSSAFDCPEIIYLSK
jgi:hypothetical protein